MKHKVVANNIHCVNYNGYVDLANFLNCEKYFEYSGIASALFGIDSTHGD